MSSSKTICWSALDSQKIRYRQAVADKIFWDTAGYWAPPCGRNTPVMKKILAARSATPRLFGSQLLSNESGVVLSVELACWRSNIYPQQKHQNKPPLRFLGTGSFTPFPVVCIQRGQFVIPGGSFNEIWIVTHVNEHRRHCIHTKRQMDNVHPVRIDTLGCGVANGHVHTSALIYLYISVLIFFWV